MRREQEQFEIQLVLSKLTTQVRNSKWVSTRLASLRWIAMLLTKMPETIYKYLLPALFTSHITQRTTLQDFRQ